MRWQYPGDCLNCRYRIEPGEQVPDDPLARSTFWRLVRAGTDMLNKERCGICGCTLQGMALGGKDCPLKEKPQHKGVYRAYRRLRRGRWEGDEL